MTEAQFLAWLMEIPSFELSQVGRLPQTTGNLPAVGQSGPRDARKMKREPLPKPKGFQRVSVLAEQAPRSSPRKDNCTSEEKLRPPLVAPKSMW